MQCGDYRQCVLDHTILLKGWCTIVVHDDVLHASCSHEVWLGSKVRSPTLSILLFCQHACVQLPFKVVRCRLIAVRFFVHALTSKVCSFPGLFAHPLSSMNLGTSRSTQHPLQSPWQRTTEHHKQQRRLRKHQAAERPLQASNTMGWLFAPRHRDGWEHDCLPHCRKNLQPCKASMLNHKGKGLLPSSRVYTWKFWRGMRGSLTKCEQDELRELN